MACQRVRSYPRGIQRNQTRRVLTIVKDSSSQVTLARRAATTEGRSRQCGKDMQGLDAGSSRPSTQFGLFSIKLFGGSMTGFVQLLPEFSNLHRIECSALAKLIATHEQAPGATRLIRRILADPTNEYFIAAACLEWRGKAVL